MSLPSSNDPDIFQATSLSACYHTACGLAPRFTLSFRDVEDLLAERGIGVSNETIRCWFLKFGRLIASNLRCSRPRPSPRWHLDEMVIGIRDRKYWLWRAVDDEGEVLDFLVQRRRCARSARKLLRKLMKKHGFAPKRITTDKLKSYPVAIRKANNRAENSHQSVRRRERKQKRFSQDPPNGSWRSTSPSTTPSTSNAIFYRAASSMNFEPRRLRSGGKVGSLPDL